METKSERSGYDTSIGSERRSVTSATKLWTIVLGIIFLLGIALIVAFFYSGSSNRSAPAANASRSPGP